MGKKYLQKRLRKKEERLKQKLKEKELAKEKMDCGCGRSPTGKCIVLIVNAAGNDALDMDVKLLSSKELAKRKTAE